MAGFPRTQIEDLSVSRLLMGTNWWLGFSHTSAAKDDEIKRTMTPERIADVMEVFLNAGVDGLFGHPDEKLLAAIDIAQDRTGRGVIIFGTPHFDLSGATDADANSRRAIDACAEMGCRVCLPHQQTTDALLDRRARVIRDMDRYAAMIRGAGMIPGLSTHMPEAPVYADETGLDCQTYIQIYNPVGFLMQIEVDWVHRMIWQRAKPVITIKPLAAGRVLPLVGLAFNWSTLRDCDMVCVGTSTPDEARDVIEISLSLLERRISRVELQKTRSKASVEPQA